MKKSILTLVGICFLIFSCQNEIIEIQEESVFSASISSSQQSSYVECVVIDADRACFNQPASNFWWPVNPETDYNDYYFSSTVDNKLSFTEYDNGTANIKGSTVRGTCIVVVDVWLKDKKDWNAWDASGGTIKAEGCDPDALVKEDLRFYVIDSSKSTISASGDCGVGRTGEFGVEQRPDPANATDGDPSTLHLGAIVGPGAALFDSSSINSDGLATWGWLTDKTTGERLHSIDFNFNFECTEVECDECEGKVTDLTLQYNGTEKANIKVKTKKEGEDGSKVVFEGMVEAGAEFTFSGNDKKGTLGTEIKIYVNGDENTKIHTSCSKPIGPGLISGDFEVISGSSREGGYLCPVDTPLGGDCGECEGKITDLELQYNGDAVADIVVKTKGKGKNKEGAVVFDGTVMPGESFSFTGNDKKGTLGTEITIYVDGNVNTKIHTSCSKPIGPGLISGSFEVISGSSREGGELCPVDVPPTGGEDDDCSECDGKITRLDLQYNGNIGANIKVVQKKDGIVVFSGNVNAGETFTFSGEDKKGTLGTEIIIYINDTESQRIHTSCSVYIGAGVVFGDFTVLGGASRNGGELCPADVPAAASGGH